MTTVLRAKCIITGDSTVGKSALCQVFHSDGSHFPKNYTMTCGVELMVKSVNIPETKDSVEIYLYDSAGKETFSDQVKKFWDHPSMVMIVYDVTNETSFNNSRKWLERVRAQKPEVRYPGVLVANKIDLEQRRVVSPKDGRDLAESCHLEYFECSAKELQNVDAIFSYLASEFYRLYHERQDYIEALTL